MSLNDVRQDLYALEQELRGYEQKYGMPSEVFYASYANGEEPPDNVPVRDWTAWASAYKLWLRQQEQHQRIVQSP